jgi:hypothetical protein
MATEDHGSRLLAHRPDGPDHDANYVLSSMQTDHLRRQDASARWRCPYPQSNYESGTTIEVFARGSIQELGGVYPVFIYRYFLLNFTNFMSGS